MNTVVKGRRSELMVMAKLLEHGFNVFECVADAQGIDCGVLGDNDMFYPIQVKSRAEFNNGDIVSIRYIRKNMFIIIYEFTSQDYWIIPVKKYQNMASTLIDDGIKYYRLYKTKKNAPSLERHKGENGIQVLKTFLKQKRGE